MTTPTPAPFPVSVTYDPQLNWWRAEASLDAFKDLQIETPEGPLPTPPAELVVDVPRRARLAGQFGPTEAQAKACQYCMANQQRIVEVCLAAMAGEVPKLRAMIGQACAPELLDKLLPVGATPGQIRKRIALQTLEINSGEKEGVAYIEYFFKSAWDPEHSSKVVLHQDRLVYVGGGGDGWRDRG